MFFHVCLVNMISVIMYHTMRIIYLMHVTSNSNFSTSVGNFGTSVGTLASELDPSHVSWKFATSLRILARHFDLSHVK